MLLSEFNFSHKMRICLLHCNILIRFTTGVFTIQECQRNFTQRCDSCTVAYTCHAPISEEIHNTANDCRDRCDLNPLCLLADYRLDNRTCNLYNCSEIQISSSYKGAVFRKSCSSDCSRFQMTLDEHSSNIIRFCQLHAITGIVTPLSCMAQCFDTDDCQVVVLPTSQNDCKLCTSEEMFKIQKFLSSSAGPTKPASTTPARATVRLIERHCVTAAAGYTTTESFIPPAPTESTTRTYSSTYNILISSFSSDFENTTSHLFSSPSLTELHLVVYNQITTFSSSSSLTVPNDAFSSQQNLSLSSNFFDKLRNIVIVSSIGGLLTITFFVVVLYYLLTRKF